MPDPIVIPERFNGPPASAHGGYAAGRVAAMGGEDGEVSLRRPPPLGATLTAGRGADGSLSVHDGEELVAEWRAIAPLELDVPDPVGVDAAREATTRFQWRDRHPFPTCYGCGPEREPGDGLRIFAGPVEGRAAMFAAPWTPPDELCGDDGALSSLGAWTALDCPSGAAVAAAPPAGPCVLARFAARRLLPAPAGEPHVLQSWLEAHDGRKRHTAAALVSVDGELRAVARALWVELR